MYFWKIDALKKTLKSKPLSEKESLKYLIATTIFYWICLIVNPDNKWDPIIYSLCLIVSVGGISYCFHKNKGNNGMNFLKTYISLSWVLGIRLFILLVIPLAFIFFIFISLLGIKQKYPTWDLLIFIIINATIYYWRLGIHIEEVADYRKHNSEA